MEPVRTHRAKSVVEAARLHRAKVRRELGLTLVEGPDLLADAESAGVKVRQVFGMSGPGVSLVDERALRRLSGTESPRGPVAVIEIPVTELDAAANVLVAVGVSDPGNVGTMIRTAAAFGWGFAYTEATADPWSPKAIRAGGGGQFQTPVVALDGLDQLAGWSTVATVVKGGGEATGVIDRPVALLIGEEAHGLEEAVTRGADYRVTIATEGPTESLNAAVAAGIVIFALSKHP